MNFPEQVGQLLWIGLEGHGGEREGEQLLRQVQPGGVIFFQRNITTADDFRDFVREVRGCLSTPPWLAMDLEGGAVDRLREALAPLPSARQAAQAGLARELGRMAGRELAAFGLNVDFAPVLDLATPESEKILGSRAAGNLPEPVTRFAMDFLEGLAESRVLGCGKHFPGLGSGRADSHRELPSIEKDEGTLWAEDLYPYRMLSPRLPMIMVAHAWYPALEKTYSPPADPADRPVPASLSFGIVSGLLKGRLGYRGLVLSDDLEMGGALEGRSLGEAAVAAVRAGCEMLLICCQASHVRNALEALALEADRDPSFRALVDEAARKVRLAKKTVAIEEATAEPSYSDWETLRRDIRAFSAAVDRRLATPQL